MRCSVCEALHREHSLMCEVEATAALQQRYDMILSPQTDEGNQDRDEIVLMSRKRQAKLTSRLERHKVLAHSA